jgi:hypothetical protein
MTKKHVLSTCLHGLHLSFYFSLLRRFSVCRGMSPEEIALDCLPFPWLPRNREGTVRDLSWIIGNPTNSRELKVFPNRYRDFMQP